MGPPCQASGLSTENLCLSSALSEESLLESEEAPPQPDPQPDQAQGAPEEVRMLRFESFALNKNTAHSLGTC